MKQHMGPHREQALTWITKKTAAVLVLLSAALLACEENISFGNAFEKLDTISITQTKAQNFVDILVVIDNSPSMHTEQRRLGERFGDFMSSLDGIDWQIGFINTDARPFPNAPGWGGRLYNLRGRSDYILTPKHPNPEHIFRETVKRVDELSNCTGETTQKTSPCPTNHEEPLRTIIQSVNQRRTHNAGFFRAGANLAVLVLSDENEMGNGSPHAVKPQMVIDRVRKVLGTRGFSVYGMVIRPNDRRCYREQKAVGNQYGTFVDELAKKTNGLTGSICDSDYGSALREISRRIENDLTVRFIELKALPLPDTLKVTFSPAKNAVKWTLKDKTIVFKVPPVQGTTVTVEYVFHTQ